MKERLDNQRLSRRTLLVGTASLVLLAPGVKPFAPVARAVSPPRMNYGRGYAGGY
jgi:hypothetical protein